MICRWRGAVVARAVVARWALARAVLVGVAVANLARPVDQLTLTLTLTLTLP